MCYNYIIFCPEHNGPDEGKRNQIRFFQCKSKACRGAIQNVPVRGDSACAECVEKSRGRHKHRSAHQPTGRPAGLRDGRSSSPSTQRLTQEEYRKRSRSNSPASGSAPSLPGASARGVNPPPRQSSADQPNPATAEYARWAMLQTLVLTRLENQRDELRAPVYSIKEAGIPLGGGQAGELYFCEANRNPTRGPERFLKVNEFDYPTGEEVARPFTYTTLGNYPNGSGIPHRWYVELAKLNIKEPAEWQHWRFSLAQGQEEVRYRHARRQVADWPLPLPYEPYHWFEDRMQLLGRTDTARNAKRWWWVQDHDASLRFPNAALQAALQAKAQALVPSYGRGKGPGSGPGYGGLGSAYGGSAYCEQPYDQDSGGKRGVGGSAFTGQPGAAFR